MLKTGRNNLLMRADLGYGSRVAIDIFHAIQVVNARNSSHALVIWAVSHMCGLVMHEFGEGAF